MEEGHKALEQGVWEEGELDWNVLFAVMLICQMDKVNTLCSWSWDGMEGVLSVVLFAAPPFMGVIVEFQGTGFLYAQCKCNYFLT
jgi:hypothetical protein